MIGRTRGCRLAGRPRVTISMRFCRSAGYRDSLQFVQLWPDRAGALPCGSQGPDLPCSRAALAFNLSHSRALTYFCCSRLLSLLLLDPPPHSLSL
eukprot:1106749-Pleurochrysis_carterae.AAC.1